MTAPPPGERPPTPAEPPPGERPPKRAWLFLAGVVGLPAAVVAGAVAEAALRASGSEGAAPGVFFAAVAGLVPVIALGLLVQLLTALTGRTRKLMGEVQRFDAEMSQDSPVLVERSHEQRALTWIETRLFVHAVVPFGAGIVVQLLVTEAVAIWCLLTDFDGRGVALALGAEVVALFVYLLCFGRILGRLTKLPATVAPGRTTG